VAETGIAVPPPGYFRKRGCKLLKTKGGVRKERAKRLQSTEKKGDSWLRGSGIASNSWEKVPQPVSFSQVLSCKFWRGNSSRPSDEAVAWITIRFNGLVTLGNWPGGPNESAPERLEVERLNAGTSGSVRYRLCHSPLSGRAAWVFLYRQESYDRVPDSPCFHLDRTVWKPSPRTGAPPAEVFPGLR
jgi:hypothetical protein